LFQLLPYLQTLPPSVAVCSDFELLTEAKAAKEFLRRQ